MILQGVDLPDRIEALSRQGFRFATRWKSDPAADRYSWKIQMETR